MLTWMLYVVVVTLALSAAAFVAERAARLRRGHSRWIWIGAIVASLLVPTVISSVSVQLPDIVAPTTTQSIVPLRAVTSPYLSPEAWVVEVAADKATILELDPVLQRIWLMVSAMMLLALIASGTFLLLRKRRWVKSTLAGVPVYITPNVGPAVVGLLHPCIVVPEWLTQASAARQTVVIAHEQSHLEAGDQRLLTIALCLLVAMPWNLPLWWQLRRLRYAIEVDCDARVLKHGHGLREYGETLIDVGERQSSFVGAVAAMSESKSFLEERISIMTRKQISRWRAAAAVLGVVSLGFVAVAAQVSPPNNSPVTLPLVAAMPVPKKQRIAVPIEAADFDRFVGTYKLNDKMIVTVTRDDGRYLAQLTGQQANQIYPESSTEFFYKSVDAQITFVADPYGQSTALVLHQNGAHMTAPRVDAEAAQQINTANTHTQVPFAATEFDRYVGVYKLNDFAVVTISREETRFLAQLTGQPAVQIYPESDTKFFYKVVDAQISFIADAQGPATALVLHQNRAKSRAPRIDAALAAQINTKAEQAKAAVAAKVQSQTPTVGSDAALRRMIETSAAGNPNYEAMAPALAKAAREQNSDMQPMLVKLGPIQAIEFIGVGPRGWDIYEVRHEHGTSEWRISLDANGIITGASGRPGP